MLGNLQILKYFRITPSSSFLAYHRNSSIYKGPEAASIDRPKSRKIQCKAGVAMRVRALEDLIGCLGCWCPTTPTALFDPAEFTRSSLSDLAMQPRFFL